MSENVRCLTNAKSLPFSFSDSQEYRRGNTEEEDAKNGCSGPILKLIHSPPGGDEADEDKK